MNNWRLNEVDTRRTSWLNLRNTFRMEETQNGIFNWLSVSHLIGLSLIGWPLELISLPIVVYDASRCNCPFIRRRIFDCLCGRGMALSQRDGAAMNTHHSFNSSLLPTKNSISRKQFGLVEMKMNEIRSVCCNWIDRLPNKWTRSIGLQSHRFLCQIRDRFATKIVEIPKIVRFCLGVFKRFFSQKWFNFCF